VESESELQLLLPRYEKAGLICEVVDELSEEGESPPPRHIAPAIMFVTCPACGQQQVSAAACRGCGQSFVVNREEKKPEITSQPVRERERSRRPIGIGFSLEGLQLFSFLASKSVRMVLLVGTLATIAYTMPGPDGKPSAMMMLLKGVANADPNAVAETMHYDPEEGKNPYAERLKSMKIDPKEFAKVQGISDGEITTAEVQGQIDKNASIKEKVEGAVSRGGDRGDTETDQKIREATGE
jgi:hypothetical protein